VVKINKSTLLSKILSLNYLKKKRLIKGCVLTK